MAERNLPHLLVPSAPRVEPYRSPADGRGSSAPTPPDRVAHASRLGAELRAAEREAKRRAEQTAAVVVEGALDGIYVVFDSIPGVDLALKSLESRRGGPQPELRTVQRHWVNGQPVERATVFVPDGKLKHFLNAVERYLATAEGVRPKRRDMIDRIQSIALASLEALWNEPDVPFPAHDTLVWWEVWLRRRAGEVGRLRAFAAQVNVRVHEQILRFPDHVVVLVQATPRQLAGAMDVLDDLAELRHPREPASLIADEPPRDQADWVAQLLERIEWPGPSAPAVCVVDTGVDARHPVLANALAPEDCHACRSVWGTQDGHGHGTEMAGLALYGDLGAAVTSAHTVRLRHRLESVKLLPGPGSHTAPELFGAITAIAASLVEIQAPTRPRVFTMATTSEWRAERGEPRPSEGYGRPSSWSAAIDALAAGLDIDTTGQDLVTLDESGPRERRLFVLAAGNVRPPYQADHLALSDVSPVEDPGQAWNALTVGAYTELDSLFPPQPGFEGYRPVAPAGELSPFSRTSVVFETRRANTRTRWPIKPDVVCEGGNLAVSQEGSAFDTPTAVQLLTTSRLQHGREFTLTRATSPASAQAAHIAATVMAQYPSLWPETVRALVVHSAQWTEPMRRQFEVVSSRAARVALQRRYGMGVPSLQRALYSASDALTLIVQSQIQPFDGDGNMGHLQLHELPWPAEELLALGEATVRMRVTLSYFVEPNPSSRGWRDRYSYPSHQLRFALRGAAESTREFEKRINKLARDEEDRGRGFAASDSAEWTFGASARTVGSLHTDIWTGQAADLAERGVVAVYPVTGWWRLQKHRDRSASGAPYGLVVSIETPEQDVDIWTPVAQQIGVPVEVEH